MEQKPNFPKLNRIPEVLENQDFSQRRLAKQLGISSIAVNNLCTQRSQPSLARLFQIAEILGVSAVDLINVDYKPEKE
ncbi:MAG: helix-turn-helix transcriptional regulator [bacterium]